MVQAGSAGLVWEYRTRAIERPTASVPPGRSASIGLAGNIDASGGGIPPIRRRRNASGPHAGTKEPNMHDHDYRTPAVHALRADLALALRAAAHHGLDEGV